MRKLVYAKPVDSQGLGVFASGATGVDQPSIMDGFRRIGESPLRPSGTLDTGGQPLRDIDSIPYNEPPMSSTTTTNAPVVTKTGTQDSWKTTVAGLLAALGLAGEQLQSSGWPEDIMGWLGFLLKLVGPILLGFFARDKNVSSEGRKVVEYPRHDSRDPA